MKVAIASGKGGTGKTLLSTNLASYWSKRQPVVLADVDVEEPNDALFLPFSRLNQEDKFKFIPSWHADACILCGQCQEICNFNAIVQLENEIMVFDELCHSCYACSELCPTQALPMIPHKIGELKHSQEGNFSFVESRLRVGEEQAVPLIAQTHQYVDAHFSPQTIMLYDCPPGTSCPMIEATKEADFVILITEPTPFGEHDVKLAMKAMQKTSKTYGVVINRSDAGDDHLRQYCKRNHIPVLATIPFDRQIAILYAQGKLVYEEIPSVRAALDQIIEFIQRL
ncbi:4Fe-4S binding protein [Microbacter margulisiae]|uniref:MinD superfamily P-loop ATPase n=1 Tax=Microbacter margulisiae TaxID=1350067 RepID=A0A7W5DP54_9PORP|nr:ATP-binding protein [Microbacter margulisiae]MBB3186509.1 MinD superfamily P-loop ATPase [Microbacter margulisiae]